MTAVTTTARKHPLAKCEECPLVDKRCAPTSGPEDAKIAFVSRSPGRNDVRPGTGEPRPFAGPSGQVLDHLLSKYGVKRDDIITTNVVLCQTDDPPDTAIKACRPRLEAEISNCELVIAGGTEAVKALTTARSISATRGFEYHRSSARGLSQRVVVTNNPAAVLRNSDAFPDMVQDFKFAFDPIPPPEFPEVEVINNVVQARSVLRRWLNTEFSYLATDLEWRDTDIYAAGFSRTGRKAVVIGRRPLGDRTCRQYLEQFYGRRDIRFIWHNGQSDTKILRRNNIAGRIDEDTFLLSYALDEEPGRHSLEWLLSAKFGWPDYTPESVKHFKKTGELPDEKAEQELYHYNGWDTAGTFQLYEYLRPRSVSEDTFQAPYQQRLLPVASAFVDVELRGFRYDVEEAANLNEREVLPRLYELGEKLRELSEHPLYNPRSHDQTRAILYNEWGLRHNLRDTKVKKLSDSTGKEVREEVLQGRFTCKSRYEESIVEFCRTLHSFTKIDTQRSRYIEGLIAKVGADGRLYCEFNPCGTVTGRSSSRSPNLQNITREGVEGIPGIRTVFLPSPGNVILQADYNQAELRTCAFLSGDKNLLAIYLDSGRSLHKERARAFYGENYTKEQYVKSKNVNFGVTYGQSAAAFAQMYYMSVQEAQGQIDSWWREFPTLLQWTNQIKREAVNKGVIRSPFGHKRRFHLITKENIGDVQRQAVDFLPQNIAAWLTLHSLIELNNLGVAIIATVHDSLVVDCPVERVEETSRLLKTVMEAQPMKQLGWEMPFTSDVSVGPNWGTLEELEVAA